MTKTAPHDPHTANDQVADKGAAVLANVLDGNEVSKTGTDGLVSYSAGSAMSYADLVIGADHVVGFNLEKDKSVLLGVPFIIISATFRDGIPNGKTRTNYVSLEAVTADANTLGRMVRAGRLSVAQVEAITPNDMVVINDGSAGIMRQVISYLSSKGEIRVPDGPEGGPVGESRYDTHRSAWVWPKTGKPVDADTEPRFTILLNCPRGLRVSEYEFANDTAATYYMG